MTEQEKRIEEMATVVPEEMKYPLDRNTTILFSASIRKAIAKKFYDTGYRKAKDIFAKCKEKCMFEGYPYGIDYTELVEVFKEFGVEVEE